MTAMSVAHSQVCSFTGIYLGLNYSVARGGKGTTEMAGRAVPEHKHHFSLALGREDKHRAIYVLLVSFPRSSQIVTCQGPLEAASTMPEQPQKRQERGGSRARLQAQILVAQVGLQQKTLRGCFLSWQVNETVARFLSVCVCVCPGGARDVAAIPTQFAGLPAKVSSILSAACTASIRRRSSLRTLLTRFVRLSMLHS